MEKKYQVFISSTYTDLIEERKKVLDKEAKTNTWKVYYRYTDWQGERKQTTKRGFATKCEALAWEREQMHKTQSDLDMTFASFVEVYTADVKSRIKENTWHTKDHIIRTKMLPYFGKRKIAEIQPKDILAWQNEMLNIKDKNGQPSQETIPMLATMAPLLTMDEVERAFVITQVLGGMKHILKNYQELLHTLEQVVKENREMKKIMQAGVDPAERTKGLLS